VGGVFLVVRAGDDGEWTWEIVRERWLRRLHTIASGRVDGKLLAAQQAVAHEALRRGLVVLDETERP
jgi:hypothetical protein